MLDTHHARTGQGERGKWVIIAEAGATRGMAIAQISQDYEIRPMTALIHALASESIGGMLRREGRPA
jgi:hypothetical protein